MPSMYDLIVRIAGDGSSFRDDVEKDKVRLDEFNAALNEVHDVAANIDVNDKDAKAKIDDLKLKLDTMKSEAIRIHLDDAEALAKLRALRVQLDSMSRVSPGGGGAGGAAAAAGASGTNPYVVGGIIAAIGAGAGPILGPLLAEAMGLVSAIGAATAGIVGFAAVAKSNLTPVTQAVSTMNTAMEAYDAAVTQAQRNAALDKIAAAWGNLDAEQKKAAVSLMSFEQFWHAFTAQFQGTILEAFDTGLSILRNLLTDMGPTIRSAGSAINTLLTEMKNGLSNSDARQFFSWLVSQAGPAILAFGTMAGNIFRGIANLMMAFSGEAGIMENALVVLTQRFYQWTDALGQSEKFQQFLQYAAQMGKVLWDTVSNLISLIMKLVVILAPVGGALLMLIDDLAKFFNALLAVGSPMRTLLDFIMRGVADVIMFADAIVRLLTWLQHLSPAFNQLLTELGVGIGLFFLAASGVGEIIALIALLIMGIVELYRAWVHDWGGIQEKTRAVALAIEDYWKLMIDSVKANFYGMAVVVLTIIDMLLHKLDGLMRLLGKVAPSVETAFKSVEDSINNARNNAVVGFTKSMNDGVQATRNLAYAAMGVREAFASWGTPGSAKQASQGITQTGSGDWVLSAHAKIAQQSAQASDAATKSANTSANAAMKNILAQIHMANATQASQQATIGSTTAATQATGSSLASRQAATLSYTQRARNIWNTYLQNMQSAHQAAKSKIDQINQQMLQNEQTAIQQYEQQLQSTTQSIADFAGNMFSAVNHPQTAVTGQQLTQNLQDQVNTISQFNSDMKTLTGQNLPQQFLQQLQNMGPQAADQIHALTQMTQSQLQQYVQLWGQEQEQANQAAVNKLTPLAQQTAAKIQQIQDNAKKQIQQVQTQYNQHVKQLTETTNRQLTHLEQQARVHGERTVVKLGQGMQSKIGGLAAQARQWGANIGNSLAAGITSAAGQVQAATQQVAQQIANNIGFHSPTKEGPGAEADRWMPALMGMLVDGIRAGTPAVSAALRQVMVPPNVASMMNQAGRTFAQSAANSMSGGAGSVEAHVHLHGPITAYGVDDLVGIIKQTVGEHAVPMLIQALQQPANAL